MPDNNMCKHSCYRYLSRVVRARATESLPAPEIVAEANA